MTRFNIVKEENLIEKINNYCLDNDIKLDLLHGEWVLFCDSIRDYLYLRHKEDKYKDILSTIVDKAIVDTVYFPSSSFPNFNLYSLLSSLWTLHGFSISKSDIEDIKANIIEKTTWGQVIDIKKYTKK